MKHLKHLFTVLLLLFTTTATAHDFNVDGIYYKITNATNKTVEVTYKGTSYDQYSNEYTGSVVIPESVTYNGTTYSVTSIGNEAFYNCTGLTSVVIPNNVTSIGNEAFYKCTGLTSIVIGNSVTSIGNWAFQGCTGLKTVYNFSNLTFYEGLNNDGSVAYYADKVYNAPNGSIEGDFIFGKPNDVNTLVGYLGNATELTLPTDYNGENYVIGSSAFRECTGLTSITIPNSVTSIGNYAFNGCTSLKELRIEDGEGTLSLGCNTYNNSGYNTGKGLFYDCPLETLYLGRNLSYNTGSYYGYSPFYNKTTLTSVTIGNSVTSIGSSAFDGCYGLTSVEIPNSVTSIGDEAFRGCTGLTSITIPNSVTSIGNNAFRYCYGLTSITIPNSVTSIGSYAFNNCTSLKELRIEDGESILSLGYNTYNNNTAGKGKGLFYDCPLETLYLGRDLSYNTSYSYGYSPFYNKTTLASVTISNSVTSIGDNAFRECTGLTSITIPNSVTSIGYEAFYNCTGLTSVVIGNSVTSIGYDVFYGCTGLKEVHISDIAAWCNISFGTSNDNPLYYAQNLYLNGETVTSLIIPDGVTSIGRYAFRGYTGLTSITIPNSVTSIGNYAFEGCTGLKSVFNFSNLTFSKGSSNYSYVAYYADKVYNAPNGSIEGDFIFGKPNDVNTLVGYLGNATELTLPADYNGKNYVIGNDAFFGCTGLTSVVIPNNVTSIGNYAFYLCTGLTSVVIPNNVTSIGNYAFAYCTGLTSVEFNAENCTTMGSSSYPVFSGCTALSTITIGENVKNIPDYAFEGCTGLKEVHISDIAAWCSIGFSSANSNPLYYAKNLYLNGELVTDITIPNSVTSIGSYAFNNCTGLTSITIPNSVTSIGSSAFDGCSGLTSVEIPNSVTSIGSSAFDGCSGLTSVEFNAENCTTMGSYDYPVFGNCTALSIVTIGENVKTIPSYAFNNCTGLTSITIPNSVTSIGNNAFSGCHWLKTVINLSNLTFSKGYSDYGDVAYYADKVYNAPNGSIEGDFIFGKPNDVNTLVGYLGNATELTLPADYNGENYVIGNDAFRGYTGLTSITIPNSVTSIENGAFSDCIGLKKAIWLTNTPPSGYKNVGATYNYVANNEYSGLSNVKVYSYLSSMFEVDGMRYVPVNPAERTCDAIDCSYNNTTSVDVIIGKTVSYKGISMNVKEIMPYALYANKKIKSVKVENEGNIGDYAFSGCTALQTADISNEGNIGDYAFSDCTALTTANISNKGSIGSCAFSGCYDFAEANLGDSVTSIGTEAFSNCKALGNIVIPDAITSIGNKAFSGCSALKSTEIGAGVTTINEATFSGCSAMTSITIGGSVKTIGQNAFYGCSALAEISIPQSVTKIENYAFVNCSSLADVIIEDKTISLSLGSNGSSPIFSDCPLDSVYIGCKITYNTSSSYGYSPFYRNTSLRTVVITDTETEIYDNEFYGCSNLKDVSIGNGVNKIGKWAFSGCSSLDYFAFGDNVQSIGEEAFSDCNNVTRILTSAMTPPVCGTQALDDINKWNCSLYVPSEAKSAYQQAEQWREFFFIEDLPLGINDVVDDENYNGFSGVYYDLNGRVVENPSSGIYIINGKKCWVSESND